MGPRFAFGIALVCVIGGCSFASDTSPIDPPTPASLSEDIVAYYPLNGTGEERVTESIACVSVGAELTDGYDGEPNGAYRFSGGDYLDCGDVLNDLDVPFSMAAWVRREGEGQAWILATDLFERDERSVSTYAGIWLGVADGKLGIDFGNGGPANASSRRGRGTVRSVVVPTDRWVHVAAVYRGVDDITLYVEGQDVGGDYSGRATSKAASSNTLHLGQGLEGRLDDVVVVRRALTSYEVNSLLFKGPYSL